MASPKGPIIALPRRGQSIPGVAYTREWRGKVIWQRWPKKIPAARSEKERQARWLFKVAAEATKTMDTYQQLMAADVAAATQLLPRDLLMMVLFKRGFYLRTPTGQGIYSVASMQDTSAVLDSLWQTPGGILFRGRNMWQGLAHGATDQILIMGPEGYPVWATNPTPPGGGYLCAPISADGFAVNTGAFSGIIQIQKAASALTIHALTIALNPTATRSYKAICGLCSTFNSAGVINSIIASQTENFVNADPLSTRRYVFPADLHVAPGDNFFTGIVATTGSPTAACRPTVSNTNPFGPILPASGAVLMHFASINPVVGQAYAVEGGAANRLGSSVEYLPQ